MNQYEVTFIVDPVLSDSEMKATAQNYVDHLKNEGCTIVHVDEMGLKQLAYTIKKRNSGFYYCIEFKSETGDFISKLELALRRDERIIRFLTIRLDKFGVKYNEDKRNGLIKKRERKVDTKKENRSTYQRAERKPAPYPAEATAAAAPAATAEAPAPVAEAPVEAKVEAAETVTEVKESAPAVTTPETVAVATESVAAEPVLATEEE